MTKREPHFRGRQLLVALAIVATSGALGMLTATPGRADDDIKKYKCDMVQNSCYAGSHDYCNASCGPSGCNCRDSDAVQ